MQAQASLAKAQQELSSGRMADIGLGLGAASGQLISLSEQQSRLQSLTDSNALATTRLSATSSAIGALNASATSFLASLTGASSTGNGSSALSGAAQGALAALVSTLNTSVSGQYIFGGINTDAQPLAPYTASPPSSTKQAVDAAFLAAFGTSQTSAAASSIDGPSMQSFLDTSFSALFAPSSFSGTWSAASDQAVSSQISSTETLDTSVSANASPFSALAQAYTMMAEFAGGNLGTAATQAVVQTAAKLISSATAGLTNLGAGVGIAQSSITDANDRMATQISLLSGRVNAMPAVDAYALSTQVSGLQTQIQASFELTSQLQQLSLVNFIK